jgi:hypothetical protein
MLKSLKNLWLTCATIQRWSAPVKPTMDKSVAKELLERALALPGPDWRRLCAITWSLQRAQPGCSRETRPPLQRTSLLVDAFGLFFSGPLRWIMALHWRPK